MSKLSEVACRRLDGKNQEIDGKCKSYRFGIFYLKRYGGSERDCKMGKQMVAVWSQSGGEVKWYRKGVIHNAGTKMHDAVSQ